jgi:hypothetical protein
MNATANLWKVFTLAITFIILAVSAQAQMTSIEVSTDADRIQFSAQGQMQAVQVEIISPSGELVFESDALNKGQAVEWRMRNEKGERVADGVYLATITVTDSSGKRRKRIEQIIIRNGISVGTEEKQEAAAAEPTPPNLIAPIIGEGTPDKLSKFTGPNSIGDSIITETSNMVGVNITPAATLQANGLQPGPSGANGTAASVLLQTSGGKGGNTTSTANQTGGAGASISLLAGNGGDAPAGSKRGTGGNITLQPGSTGAGAGAAGASGNVLIAPTGVGNVGIGTASPTSRLTVNGGIQILGTGNGIKFADGSIQTKSATDPASNLTWTGTTGSLVKFTGANSLGNSLIRESGSNVGIGTPTPARALEIATGGLRLSSNLGDVEFTEVADLIGWATTANPNPNMPALRVHGGANFPLLFTVMNNGNVGIGTTNPTAPLSVQSARDPILQINHTGTSGNPGLWFQQDGITKAYLWWDQIGKRLNVGTPTKNPILSFTESGRIMVPAVARYKSIHGSAFMPATQRQGAGGSIDPSASYYEFGLTANYDTSAYPFWTASVELPDGAVITEFCLSVIDVSGYGHISANLGRVNLNAGGYNNPDTFVISRTFATSESLNVQNVCAGSIPPNDGLVDNSRFAYWINARMQKGHIVGARIRYELNQIP